MRDLSEDDLLLLRLLADEKSSAQIAQMVGTSLSEVEHRIARMLEVFETVSVRHAVARAIEEGLIGPLAGRPFDDANTS
jgi:DNA-binding CsgD family transcriptional regulator